MNPRKPLKKTLVLGWLSHPQKVSFAFDLASRLEQGAKTKSSSICTSNATPAALPGGWGLGHQHTSSSESIELSRPEEWMVLICFCLLLICFCLLLICLWLVYGWFMASCFVLLGLCFLLLQRKRLWCSPATLAGKRQRNQRVKRCAQCFCVGFLVLLKIFCEVLVIVIYIFLGFLLAFGVFRVIFYKKCLAFLKGLQRGLCFSCFFSGAWESKSKYTSPFWRLSFFSESSWKTQISATFLLGGFFTIILAKAHV